MNYWDLEVFKQSDGTERLDLVNYQTGEIKHITDEKESVIILKTLLSPKKGHVKCPVCGHEYCKGLYTLGYIGCYDCGIFFDTETRKVLPVNDRGQVILKPSEPEN